MRKGGKQVQQQREAEIKKRESLKIGDILIGDAGKLHCQNLVHVIGKSKLSYFKMREKYALYKNVVKFLKRKPKEYGVDL